MGVELNLFFALLSMALSSAIGDCQPPGAVSSCTENVDSLSELLSKAQEFNAAYENTTLTTVCVDLDPRNTSTLGYSNITLQFSVIIRGGNSTVRCESGSNLSGYYLFPLRFESSDMVMIHEVTFEGCARPLKFELIRRIHISSSYFRNFNYGGTIEILNSPIICIQDSSFVNGTSMGIGTREFSGNAGGVAIGYSSSETDEPPNISILSCEFRNNIASAAPQFKYSLLTVLATHIYNQRGGGMAIYFGASNYSGTITIQDTAIVNNAALASGGGIYMYLGGTGSFQNITIDNTSFTGNEALDGGGLEITHFNSMSYKQPNQVTLVDCSFSGNRGKFGGGYKNIQLHPTSNLNNLLVRDTLFENNEASFGGAGIYLQSLETIDKVALFDLITLESCTFTNNSAERGVIFVIGNVITIKGNTLLEESTGPALRVLGILVELKDNITIRNNRYHPSGLSGSIYLSSFGQIKLYAQTYLTFLNNNGTEGACIVVKGQLIAAAFTRKLYNPQCFLQYEDPTMPPPEWDVTMKFEGNRADVGPVVLMPDSEICKWTSTDTPFFSTKNLSDTWSFMTMKNNLADGTDTPERYIQTGISTLDLITTYASAYPGEPITLNAMALDQFGQSTSAFINISASSSSENITFQPSIVPLSSKNPTIKFQYFLGANRSNSTIKFQYFLGANRSDSTVSLNSIFTPEQNMKIFTLHHDKCLPGHMLMDSQCMCNTNAKVILCQGHSGLLLADGLWGTTESDELITYECPHNYCKCEGNPDDPNLNEGCQLLYNDDNGICNYRRNGTLCGRCKNGTGVGMLTNNCQEHEGPPHYYWLVPLYFISATVTLVVLVKLGVKIPTVFRGFLIYIQIAPIALAYIQGLHLYTEPLPYVTSLLALYIPYDFSFHAEMTSLESYGLRYFPPLIALITVPIAASVRHHRFKYWHGIWTIILLMYTMTVETSVSILFCPTLKFSNSSIWFFDGEQRCYEGWHMFLTIVALLALLAQALLIIFVAASVYYKTLCKKYIKFEKLERFSIVVTHGIKDECKWWPIAELGCRYIFVISVVLSPGYVAVPLVLSIIIFVMQTIIHPYQDKIANFLESLILLWLVGLLSLGNATILPIPDGNGWPLLYLPVVCGFIVLVVYIVLQIRKLFLLHKDRIKKNFKKRTTSQSVGNIYQSVSYRFRKLSSGAQSANIVTNTIVGFEESADVPSREIDTHI